MSERLLDQLLNDRSSALRPTAVLQGISCDQQLRLLKEIDDLVMITRGHFTGMEHDGVDLRSECGVILLRVRCCVDELEAINCRVLHDRDGVIIEGSYERK